MSGEARMQRSDNLVQADLSHLRIQEMRPVERAELLRRYADFISHFRVGEVPSLPKKIRKWVPGENTRGYITLAQSALKSDGGRANLAVRGFDRPVDPRVCPWD